MIRKNPVNCPCYNCSGPHFRNKCPELKNNKSAERDKVLFSAFSVCDKPDTWYIDSGATSHMTNYVVPDDKLVKPKKIK